MITAPTNVTKKIKTLFEESGVDYEIIEHEPVHTSLDAAKVRGTAIDLGAKALVLFADKKPLLAVVPGNTRLDTKKFKKTHGVKDLRFATPEQVTELTTLEIGSIPPLGSVMGLSSYFDSSFEQKDKVVFNCGAHTISIVMKAKDLIKVENPVISSIV